MAIIIIIETMQAKTPVPKNIPRNDTNHSVYAAFMPVLLAHS
jgi:hypothetical protein